MPQLVVARPVEPGERLPLVQQLAQPVDPVPPVVAGGDRLGLGHELVLARWLPRFAARSALRSSRWWATIGVEGFQPGPQAVQVADGLGIVDRAGHLLDRGAGVVGGHGARLDPLLQQVHLERESSYRRV